MIKFGKFLLLALVLSGFALQNLEAGNRSRIGTAGAQELLIPVGARGIALGNSSLANATGVEAIFWNPAGVVRSDYGTEVMFSHMNIIADIGVDYGAVAVNAGDFGTLAFSIKSLSFGDIPVTTDEFTDGTGEFFSPTFVTVSGTYAKMLNERISVGGTLNIISEKIMSTSASGFGISAGVQYHGLVIPELKLGVAVKNIGSSMKYDGSNLYYPADVVGAERPAQFYKIDAAEFDIPSTLEIGLAYDRKINDMNAISVATNFQNNNYQADELKVGAEYAFNNMIFVRGGYLASPNAQADEYIYDYAFGFGINYDLGGLAVKVDYAYRHLKSLDANNIITVNLGF